MMAKPKSLRFALRARIASQNPPVTYVGMARCSIRFASFASCFK